MYKRRIGNDIPIKWNIKQYGEEYTIPEGNNDVYLLDNTGSSVPITYTISGSAISFTFLGKNQKRTGAYTLKYVHNDGIDGMVTIDKVRFLELVDHNYQAEDVQTLAEMDEIVVESDIELPSNGYSAYDLAVQHGYVGTEAQWVESLKKPATDAAATANSAAAAANSAAAEANSAAESASTAANAASTQASAASVAAQSANTAATAANNAASVANAAADRLDVDLSGKVDKVIGKGLSTEDYTPIDKAAVMGSIYGDTETGTASINLGDAQLGAYYDPVRRYLNKGDKLKITIDTKAYIILIDDKKQTIISSYASTFEWTADKFYGYVNFACSKQNNATYTIKRVALGDSKVDKAVGYSLIDEDVADEMHIMLYQEQPTIEGTPDTGVTEIPGELKTYVNFENGIIVNKELYVGAKKLVFNDDGSVTWTN